MKSWTFAVVSVVARDPEWLHRFGRVFDFTVGVIGMVVIGAFIWWVISAVGRATKVLPGKVRHALSEPEVGRLKRSMGERIVIASAAGVISFLVLYLGGFSTDVKLLVIPLGIVAVFIGISFLG